MEVEFTNIGQDPIVVPYSDFEVPASLFANLVGLQLELKGKDGHDFSRIVGGAMQDDPPLDCMSADERSAWDGGGQGHPTSSAANRRTPATAVPPGGMVSTPPRAFQFADDKYCGRAPPPAPIGQFSELPGARYLPQGQFLLTGRMNGFFRGKDGKPAELKFDLPPIALEVIR
jgi:hypothetical protein